MLNSDIAPGGIVDRSNNSAPKEIKSDNLVSFSCSYFLYGEISRDFDSSYGISVKKDASGKFVLSEEETSALIFCVMEFRGISRIYGQLLEVCIRKLLRLFMLDFAYSFS